ncbi:diguanylate cyclase [Stenotrophobium rhamnosiphilum]|nr:diguanylate cyclase [Stenotrophobium rhamnosiphilum]
MASATYRNSGHRAGIGTPDRLGFPALLSLIVAYVLGGKLSMALVVAPGFAAAIFAPAGIAIGAVLIGGYMTLPWIFAGSILFCLWNGAVVNGHLDAHAIYAVLLMSLAAVAQAAVGGAVLRRALGPSIAMDHGRPLIRFAIFTPLICTISASLSLASLFLLGAISREILVSSWFIWWIGDSLAVLLVVPLTLMLCGEPRQLWRRRLITVGIPMVGGLLLFVVIFLRFGSWEKRQALLEFDRLSQQVSDRIQTRFEGQEIFLQQAEAFLSSGDAVTEESFKNRVGRIFMRYPSVMAVEWAPRVMDNERQDFEARNNLRIREQSADRKTFVTAPEHKVYYPINFIEPRSGNEEMLGFNLADQRIPLAVLNAAATAERTLISPPITLLQDRGKEGIHRGLLVLYPVSSGPEGPGFVASVIRVNQFMNNALPFLKGQLYLRIVDREATVTLFDNFQAGTKTSFEASLHFGGRDYHLQTAPSAEYFRSHRAWQSWAILVVGLSFTALLSMALLLSTGHAARIEALVISRTADLNDEKNFSETVINSLPGVFYMLDRAGDLTQWNSNFGRVFSLGESNVKTEDVLKTIVKEDHALIEEAIRRVYATRGYAEVEVRQDMGDGKLRHYLVNGQYTKIAGRHYMFGTGMDLTEIQNARARLHGANVELERRVKEIHALQALLQEQAIRDPLSGLYNRRYLDETLDRELSKAQREGYPISIVMGDIDHFKNLNDTYGHQAGDAVIRLLSGLLRDHARASDILCRFGGEEFLLVMPGIGMDDAYVRVDQWRALFAQQRLSFGVFELSATVSFGISAYPVHGKTAERLIAVADEALYLAKANSRNRVECASPSEGWPPPNL